MVAAAAVAGLLGAGPGAVRDAVASFRGVRRRMEVFLECARGTFVDDFAHHPTAIRETVEAARARWHGRKLRVLFEPRSNTTVTRRFQADLAEAFHGADEVWLGPIHRAERIPEEERLDRAEVVRALSAGGVEAHYSDDVEVMVAHLHETARENDVVLVLSNGAFGGIYARLKTAFADG